MYIIVAITVDKNSILHFAKLANPVIVQLKMRVRGFFHIRAQSINFAKHKNNFIESIICG